MVHYVGKYNVDLVGYVWDGDTKYYMVIVSEFDGDKEIQRKAYYFLYDKLPALDTEEKVAACMQFPDKSKLSFKMIPQVTSIV